MHAAFEGQAGRRCAFQTGGDEHLSARHLTLRQQRTRAFTARRPRITPAQPVSRRRRAPHQVAAKPLNEGSSDEEVRAALASGERQPGVLDKVAAAIMGVAASAAQRIAGSASAAAAADLQPPVTDAGSSATLDRPAAAQAGQPADNIDGNAAVSDSQEWLTPRPPLPDQTPPGDAHAAGGASAAADAAPAPQQLSEAQLDAAVAQLPEGQREAAKTRIRTSWAARDKNDLSGKGGDFLYELGQTDYNTNVDVGATAALGLDALFHGNKAFGLGAKSDIADGSLRGFEFRKFDNIQGDYYISPAFLEAVTMHIAKNFLSESLHHVRVPVILGIWGPKGCGKTFQTELAFRKLGVEPIIMSAGELEHEWAGTPGRLVRERYRRAAELSKVRGKLSCLLINDLDAGLGHFSNTQTTVNNQNVVGTLMNIADDPTRVSGGGSWREHDVIRRIPIIVTGNDFSTLYAPLIRNGRMEKFYWKPTRTDLLEILQQMYKDDGVSRADLEVLLDTFPDQPLDFFGAIRAGTYDNQIRRWIKEEVVQGELVAEDANLAALGQRLLDKDRLPKFNTDHVNVEALLAEGQRLREEQAAVGRMRLSKDYLKDTGRVRQSMIGLQG